MFTMPDKDAPTGSGVGEPASSVRFPPLTAKTDTKLWPAPSTRRYLPSGVRRASMSEPPPLMTVLPMRASEPSWLMA